jgi:hypothetical protein
VTWAWPPPQAGKVIAQLVKANTGTREGHGLAPAWGRSFHIVFMTKGWAKFMYEATRRPWCQAGDCVHQRPGITHYLFDYSPDMEYLEVVEPGRLHLRRHAEAPAEVPAATLAGSDAAAGRHALAGCGFSAVAQKSMSSSSMSSGSSLGRGRPTPASRAGP